MRAAGASSLSRYPLPARFTQCSESDAPPRASGKDTGANPEMAGNLPDLAIRSTFIVGFPGETEEDFSELLGFLTEAKLERVGAFNMSRCAAPPRMISASRPFRSRSSKAAMIASCGISSRFPRSCSSVAWASASRDHRRARPHREQGPLGIGMPRRLTALVMSHRSAPCAPAISSR